MVTKGETKVIEAEIDKEIIFSRESTNANASFLIQ